MRGGFGWGLVRFEGFLGDEMMVRRGVGCVCYPQALNHIFRTTTLFPIRPKPTLSPFQPFFPVHPFPWHDAILILQRQVKCLQRITRRTLRDECGRVLNLHLG